MACFERTELEEICNNWATLMERGNLAYLEKDWEEAEHNYRAALTTSQKLSSDYPHQADSLSTLAQFLSDCGRYLEAEIYYNKLLDLREMKLGKEHPFIASMLEKLADFYVVQAKYETAEKLFEQARSIRKNFEPKHSLDLAYCLERLAYAQLAYGNFASAEKALKEALRIRNKALGANDLGVASTLHALSGIHKCQGDEDDAATVAAHAKSIWSKKIQSPAIVKKTG